MNTENLQKEQAKLLNHMMEVGYSAKYVQVIHQVIRHILMDSDKWNSYDDLLKEYVLSNKKYSNIKTLINIIASFDIWGVLPRTNDERSYFHNSLYYQLNKEYRNLIDFYKSNADRSVKKESTIYNECRNTGSFLFKIQNVGIDSLSAVTEGTILGILTNEDGYPSFSASYVNQLIAVFRGTVAYNNECQRIAYLIPSIRQRRKNIQYLEAEERSKVKEALHDEENSLSYRNRAIGFLLYYTGLRCCDISNLTFDDIDWDKDELSIYQQKTGVPIKLPLTAIVGNSIYDYITLERRKSDEPHIFLSYTYPYKKLTSKAIGNLAAKVYDAAEIRMSYGDRRGGHIFRHNFATIDAGKWCSDSSHKSGFRAYFSRFIRIISLS